MDIPQPELTHSFADDKIRFSREDGIGFIQINNPTKHNAMSLDMWEGLAHALRHAASDTHVRVLVLQGAGDRAFVSGADISQFEQNRSTPQTQADYARRASAYRELLMNFPRPTIASIRGFCLGGGLALAMGTDIRVAAASSQFGIPAARLSIAYPFEGVRTLVNLVGNAWARMLLYTGTRIDALRAERIGLITLSVPDAELTREVRALAERIAQNAPLSVAAAKATIDQVLRDPDQRDLSAVQRLAAQCATSEDAVEGRRAFMEKREPRFHGR